MYRLLPPKYLYKYKPLLNREDMVRLEDIIINNRLYFPHYSELNDPIEGQVIGFNALGYAGSSLHLLADEEDPFIVSEKKKYRILSLSDIAVSTLMWTHYANMYNGVCLCYSSDAFFKNAKPVIYRNSLEKYSYLGKDSCVYSMSQIIYSSFFYKQEDWRYEHEWRIVSKSRKKYFSYGETDLVGIIIGNNVSEYRKKKIKKIIIESGYDSIKLLKACPGYKSASINILPLDYKFNYTGDKLHRIEDVNSYFDDCRIK